MKPIYSLILFVGLFLLGAACCAPTDMAMAMSGVLPYAPTGMPGEWLFAPTDLHMYMIGAAGTAMLNAETVKAFFTGLKTEFQNAFNGTEIWSTDIAMEVPSATKTEKHGWLKLLGALREWIGPRLINRLEAEGYELTNKDYEHTIGVKRTDFEDAGQLVQYSIIAKGQGELVRKHRDRMVAKALKAGFSTACHDGQNFFDTDHPSYDADGAETTASNSGAGSGALWVLVDESGFVRPLIYQNRKKFEVVARTDLTDENVFMRNEYEFGVDGRNAVGYGLWQKAYGSKSTLNDTNFNTAFQAMQELRGPGGSALGVTPTTLYVAPSLRAAAMALVASKLASGADNPNAGIVKVRVISDLA